ncbi:CGNR zinc finger domain-containing protein [Chitinophaga sp. sic0106]|uniref:CGNR zinc finger domain-containing protein n=1 Tax=Chitinophaga sp. sic0106 TaxID=2854785 RepID=UPI001C48ED21|nr:CGNR zinc finger domain-containing protein [Chitinophaga sp. sic0106]MBV7530120.1 CGNR zinc finger domain-containing protein [Chitinophaga sp. sic0106]
MNAIHPITLLRLNGGVLCLDFCNTVSNRNKPEPGDYLAGFRDITVWYDHIKGMPAKSIQTLERIARDYPAKAAQVFDKSIQLRELLYRLFGTIAKNKQPDQADLTTLTGYISDAYMNMALSWDKQSKVVAPDFNAPALEQVIWRIADSALELLSAPQLAQVKECPACGWLFLDKSRNGSRRWCSMSTCGDVHKVTRFQQRNKKKS